jgi:hypothetical protein
MIWLIIVLLSLLIFLCWLLHSAVVVEIDSRIPAVNLRWAGIGKAVIWYDKEWWLSMQILFYKKTIRFSEMKSKPRKKLEPAAKKKPKRRMKIAGF